MREDQKAPRTAETAPARQVPASIIAIDGPVASGKTAVGLKLARQLGYRLVDTGMIYRAITWLALDQGLEIEDKAAVTTLAESDRIALGSLGERDRTTVSADGRDISDELRSPAVDRSVSYVSRMAGVRRATVELQRAFAREGRIIMLGRDIGSVVLPDAPVKIYLDATPAERARRRHLELSAAGVERPLAEITSELAQRDEMDRERHVSPPEAGGRRDDPRHGRTVPRRGGRARRGNHRHSALRAIAYRVIVTFCRYFVLPLYATVEVEGLEKMPRQGPLILVSNHLNDGDPGIFSVVLPRPIAFMAKAELFGYPVMKQFMDVFGFPVRRDEADLSALRRAQEILREGRVIGLFPEGRRRRRRGSSHRGAAGSRPHRAAHGRGGLACRHHRQPASWHAGRLLSPLAARSCPRPHRRPLLPGEARSPEQRGGGARHGDDHGPDCRPVAGRESRLLWWHERERRGHRHAGQLET